MLKNLIKRLRLAWRYFRANDFDYGYGLEILEDKWERLYFHLLSQDAVAVHQLSDMKALGRAVKLLKRQRRGYWTLVKGNNFSFAEAMEKEQEEWNELWELVKNHGQSWWD